MFKYLILIIIIFFIYKFFIIKNKGNNAVYSIKKNEDIVPCAKCGVHLPKSQAIVFKKKYYCCEGHKKDN